MADQVTKDEKDKKNFVLMQDGKDTNVVFSNAQPRGAALKAANRGFTDIRLRERGTKRVHVLTANASKSHRRKNAPLGCPLRFGKLS